MTWVLPSAMFASRSSYGAFCPKSDIAARKEMASRPKLKLKNLTLRPQSSAETVQRADRRTSDEGLGSAAGLTAAVYLGSPRCQPCAESLGTRYLRSTKSAVVHFSATSFSSARYWRGVQPMSPGAGACQTPAGRQPSFSL